MKGVVRVIIGAIVVLTSSVCPAQPGSPLADIGPAPAVKLTDSENKPFDLATKTGKCVLVSFVFTTCNGTCPLTTRAMAECRDELKKAGHWGRNIEFVSITLDPAHDTSEVLKSYAASYEADPKTWHFLTGATADVDRVIADWGMWAKRDKLGVLDHPSRVFLIDPKGHQREIYSLEFLKPMSVVADVKGLLSE